VSALRQFKPLLGCLWIAGKPFVEPLVHTPPNWVAAADRDCLRSYAVLPLKTGEQVSGFLIVLSDQPNAFDENLIFHLRIFADHASIALYNAQLHAQLKKALEHETEMRNHMLQQEHLAAMGRMVSLVAHALNNPLQALINSIYLAGQEIPADSAAHEFLKFAQKDIHRLSSLIAQLREVYRPSTSDKKTTLSLKSLLQETYHLIEAQLPLSISNGKFRNSLTM
jgi:signal transduction histidine kinase